MKYTFKRFSHTDIIVWRLSALLNFVWWTAACQVVKPYIIFLTGVTGFYPILLNSHRLNRTKHAIFFVGKRVRYLIRQERRVETALFDCNLRAASVVNEGIMRKKKTLTDISICCNIDYIIRKLHIMRVNLHETEFLFFTLYLCRCSELNLLCLVRERFVAVFDCIVDARFGHKPMQSRHEGKKSQLKRKMIGKN